MPYSTRKSNFIYSPRDSEASPHLKFMKPVTAERHYAQIPYTELQQYRKVSVECKDRN